MRRRSERFVGQKLVVVVAVLLLQVLEKQIPG
jgi:hypothetical protein